MNDDPSLLRDQTISLLVNLTDDNDAAGVEPGDGHLALRHLGIAALNLATEVSPDALLNAGHALPWLAIFSMWQQHDVGHQELVDTITRHGLAPHFGPQTLRRRLSRAAQAHHSPIRRAPSNGDDADELGRVRAHILRHIVDHDRRIAKLMTIPAHERRDGLIDDAGLLAAVLELSAEARENQHAASLVDHLPQWPITTPSDALEILARFEGSHFEDIPNELGQLGDRSQRFEQSLAIHLERHGLLAALHAALAFAPAADQPTPEQRELRRYLTGFSPLATDPTLLELTIALITVRHRALDHLRGARTLDALSPWITYLRGPCMHFAEARDITLREATNFAHYAFHLLNICDLASLSDVVLRDPLRRALMDLEDELKEFALVGQRQGLSDEQSDLHRYEKTRWRNQGPRALLADRIARLSGLWQAGHRSGPPGSPPQLDHHLYADCLEQVHPDQERAGVDAAAHLIRRAQFRGHQWLEGWRAGDIISLLIAVLSSARQALSIDVDHPFVVDLSPLQNWLGADDHQRRADILRTLLAAHSDDQWAHSSLLKRSTGLSADAKEQRLVIDFHSSRPLEALLTLLADAEGNGDDFTDALLQRLDDLLGDVTPTLDEPASDNRARPSK